MESTAEMTTTPPDRRRWILASIIAAMFMISIEATIVSTAMPQIVAQLNADMRLYTWVFSIFLLAQTSTTMMFGRLSDMFGRKPILLIGIALFLVSSLLCGLAWSMTSLIVFRLFQGLAAGALQPVTQTLIGDLYPGLERGRVQGYLAASYGVSSVMGPLVGGLIVENIHWAWIFWMNIPIGLVTALGFQLFIHENRPRQRAKVDYLGPILFIISIASLMLSLRGVSDGVWTSVALFGGLFAVGISSFFLHERRTPHAMLSLDLLTRAPLTNLNLLATLNGVVLISTIAFVPIYVQVAMGYSAVIGGLTLTVQVLGWVFSAAFAMKLVARVGRGGTLLTGAVCMPLGALFLVTSHGGLHPAWPGAGSLLIGVGLGFLNTTMLMTVQESVEWKERGIVTSLLIFSRHLGSALGAALLGMIVNLHVGRPGATGEGAGMRDMLEGSPHDPATMQLHRAFDHGMHLAFWATLAAGVVAVFLALNYLRRHRPVPVEG